MTDTTDRRVELHTAVLADLAGSKPKDLVRALKYQAEDISGADDLATEDDIREMLVHAESTDQLVSAWRLQLHRWDSADVPQWSDSAPLTLQRRDDAYSALKLQHSTRKLFSQRCPIWQEIGPVVISKKFKPWYKPGSGQGTPWYWPAYRDLLISKGWPDTAVASVEAATDQVVERLADPTRGDAYQSKGLVVGYVQSGKTANFTGVIAKAMDAGYRLVIVLGGTLNLLRDQTQRRLDMELVGRENILRGAHEDTSEYADDPAWGQKKFASFGRSPSTLGAFDIIRMTTRDDDYQSLLQGIVALEFEKKESSKPLYDSGNLHQSNARLMVVKKNKAVLGKLVKDLLKIKTPLSEIPVLIIDDESDEASLNTTNMSKPNAERTAINQKISLLLNLLPRAQYVGYTATPFANVFVDPSDSEDIFPKDFIISLPRPTDYMGAQDFHDLDSPVAITERTVENSNEKAHVRNIIISGDKDESSLQTAIDMFVLTAAIKLYREDKGGLGDRYFQHHTMLIHESVRTDVQRELSGTVTRLWWDSSYTGPAGRERLRALFDEDIKPVSHHRAGGQAIPATFEELAGYVGPAAMRIGGDDRPIIVVNSDTDIENGVADFDKRSIWKILIGGQKLSRGFTVEGLTVTYFRRRAQNAATLMQMGRWFGFREGYRDLVRLYLGREEKIGTRKVDLYSAFEAICLDEESFRSELKQYSVLINGKPQLLPSQVPPLVSQHLPWLKPASPNKMFNAQLVEIATPGEWQEPTAYPAKVTDLRHNTALWSPVLHSLSKDPHTFRFDFKKKDGTPSHHSFQGLTGTVGAGELLTLLEQLKWSAPSQFGPHLTYLREISRGAQPSVNDWLVVAPQHSSRTSARHQTLTVNGQDRKFSYFARDRRRGPLFGAISDPKHRGALMTIAGSFATEQPVEDALFIAPKRGVLVLYPLVESTTLGKYDSPEQQTSAVHLDLGGDEVVLAFSFVAPGTARSGDRVIRFKTIDSSKPDIAIIDR
ncbi:Z1 domain-containing protein [Rhodococcoides fascians]|uniref:Z1 domain-containing protein n=1 Tax=Rhodococcoides fascians TaxID=1828 RepID=UPI001DA572B6|nr:Z1 domain-containing protein [Rhodococcus fascians]CAH0229960.1 hypothetical protein SRABI91_02612 [Rhodococcus fascians]